MACPGRENGLWLEHRNEKERGLIAGVALPPQVSLTHCAAWMLHRQVPAGRISKRQGCKGSGWQWNVPSPTPFC